MIAAIPIGISGTALLLSIYVFVENRRQYRRNALLRIHQLLMSDDVQRGRYLLFEKVIDESSIQNLSSQDYGDINRALAAFNLLGLYVQKGYVEEKEVMDIWARPVYRSWIAAQPFFAHREQHAGYRLSPFFDLLAQ